MLIYLSIAENWPSGRRRTLGKRVRGNPSGVRISCSPPSISNVLFLQDFFISNGMLFAFVHIAANTANLRESFPPYFERVYCYRYPYRRSAELVSDLCGQ